MRTYTDLFPACPTFFTPFQTHPREMLDKATEAWVGWMRDHVCSLSSMIETYHSSVVVAGAQLDYTGDYGFGVTDSITIKTHSSVHKKGLLIAGESKFMADDVEFAKAVIYFRPVSIGDEASAAAKSTQLNSDVLRLFEESERFDRHNKKATKNHISKVTECGTLLAEGEHSFRLHRYAMDFADQWAFMESYAFVSAAREELALTMQADAPELVSSLGARLSKYYIDLKKPYFLFDCGSVKSKAYDYEGKLCFVHDLCSVDGETVHASVYEDF